MNERLGGIIRNLYRTMLLIVAIVTVGGAVSGNVSSAYAIAGGACVAMFVESIDHAIRKRRE